MPVIGFNENDVNLLPTSPIMLIKLLIQNNFYEFVYTGSIRISVNQKYNVFIPTRVIGVL